MTLRVTEAELASKLHAVLAKRQNLDMPSTDFKPQSNLSKGAGS